MAHPLRRQVSTCVIAALCVIDSEMVLAHFKTNTIFFIAGGMVENHLQEIRERYLQVVARALDGTIYEDPPLSSNGGPVFDLNLRTHGWDWPSVAFTMVGTKRLHNVRLLLESVIGEGIPGDFVETGVWRGGACIMARAVLQAYGVKDRSIIACDSFEGLPEPNASDFPADEGSTFHTYSDLAVSLEQVKANFAKFDLLDDQVVFLKGWFRDTMSKVPSQQIAVLRLDGDMYESTIDPLRSLYDRIPAGGYVIVDDYHVVEASKIALHDFLAERGETPTLHEIDGVGVFFRKEGPKVPEALKPQGSWAGVFNA